MSHGAPAAKVKPLLIESIREIRQLRRRLAEAQAPGAAAAEPIAIVGAGCRFPGGAEGVDAYWDFLRRGGDGVREIPAERWPADAYFDPRPGRSGRIYTRAAGIVEGVDRFDAEFFGISPREAAATDPQHRLLLETAWEALENAALVPAALQGTRTGIYVGLMGQDYSHLTHEPEAVDLYTGIGNLASVAAGRLAYWLGTHGPVMSIDTACSSSLVAVHVACRHLRSGEADVALAGGVNLILSPLVMAMICAARMLSPDGRCKTFDRSADGFGRGEGCGLVVLKRLSDAERDGDRIIALIHGTAVNHGGRAAGLTVPSPAAQAEVIRQALADARLQGHDVQLLEAHGTGTALGDPIELSAAAEAYGADRQRVLPLLVGSVKTNFGHLEGAAGIASLIKAALAVQAGEVPPHLHLTEPNPHIDWSALAVAVPQALTPWPATEGPRRAGVSSFGLSGTNAHVIVGQPPAAAARAVVPPPARTLLLLSARTPEALRAQAGALAAWLAASNAALDDVAFTLLAGRQHFAQRAAVVAADRDDAVAALQALAQGRADARVCAGSAGNAGPAATPDEARALAARCREHRGEPQALNGLLLELATLYAHGALPDAGVLFAGLGARRIALPTYRFQRQRHWLDVAEPAAAPAGTLVFDGHEPFLDDHRVHGERVLPAVVGLERVCAAVRASAALSAAPALRLRHVAWERPLTVGSTPVSARIDLQPQPDGSLRFELCSTAGGPAVRHMLGHAQVLAPQPMAPVDLAALRARCCLALEAPEAAYARFARAGLVYGPRMRALQGVHVGQGEALARLALPPNMSGIPAPGPLPPALLDSALQALVALAPPAEGTATLPFALDEFDVLAPCGPAMWAHVRETTAPTAGALVRRFDIDLLDDAGHACVRWRGLSARASAAPAPLLFAPRWQPLAGTPAALPPGERQVWLAVPAADAPALAQRLRTPCTVLEGDFARQATALLASLQAQAAAHRPALLQLVVPSSGPGSPAAGLAGLLKTAALEAPSLRVQTLLVDTADTTALAGWLDAAARQPATELRCSAPGLHRRAWDELPATAPQRPWKEGGVYLVTGGLGGLGRIVARDIAHHTRGAVLVLAGRHLPHDAQAWVHELQALGAVAEVQVLDVADAAAVRRLVLQVRERHGALHGIVHAAGVLADALLPRQSAASLRAVFAPKVDGTLNLDAATRDLALDAFICFSSVSAVQGHVGQAGYAAANAFLDAFTAERNARVAAGLCHGRTLAVNWPLWREGGMQVAAAVERAVTQSTGLGAMDTAAGLDALYRAWGSGHDQVAVLAGEPARVRAWMAPAEPLPPPSTAAPAAAAEPSADRVDAMARHLRGLLAASLRRPESQIDLDAPMEAYGLDSILAMELTSALEATFGALPKTLFFEHRTLRALAGHFAVHHAAHLKALQAPAGVPEPALAQEPGADPVAVIGLAGRYPQAPDLDAFWALLRDGVDAVTEVPPERWDHAAWWDADPEAPGRTYARWGGFIDGVDEFDAAFFGIAPREAERMDPQERLFLQCAWAALEDAGCTRESLAAGRAPGEGAPVGVFVGVMYQEYQLHAAQAQARGEALTAGASAASVANRVSHVFDFSGPSLAVDTMCSSSLTALHLACESLRRGECEVALAGGVNVSVHPNKFLLLGQGRFASSQGRCTSFGAGGDGYVPAEGVGAVLLKPLARALADGDRVLGVLRGSALNHGGRTHGYTVPNPLAQAEVVARALRQAGLAGRDIGYVEAHGTGTALGDPIEVAGLARAFGPVDGARCAIGSVKSNIGHAESAAGIAGLTKVLLQMRHGQLVPSLHAATLNPHIDFAATPFVVQQALAPWPLPRRAGLSSFGAGGANAHVVVEAHVETLPDGRVAPGASALIVLSARTEDRLRERVRQLLQAIERGDVHDGNLAHAAYTLQVGREPMAARLALAVADTATLRQRLQQVLDGETPAGVHRGMLRRGQAPAAAGPAPEVLASWVAGAAVDWRALSGGRALRRIGLPTYPFARERHWLPLGEAPTAPAALHPLAQHNVSGVQGLCFAGALPPQAFYLRDHRVQGRPVLPAAAQLEMARAAAAQALGDAASGLHLRDVVWLQPAVAEDEATALHLQLRLQPLPGGELAFELHGAEPGIVHSQGRVERLASPPPAALDATAWRAAARPSAWSAEACYEAFARRGLQYGPAHRVITAVWEREGQVLAHLALPPTLAAGASTWGLHPALLDGALQVLLPLQARPGDGPAAPALPFALESLEAHAACGASAWVLARQAGSGRGFDIDLYDEAGRPCAGLRGFSTRALDGAAGRPAHPTLLFAPEWQPAAPAETASSAPVPQVPQVLLAGVGVPAEALAARLGWPCEALAGDFTAQAAALLARLQAAPQRLQVVVPSTGPASTSRGLAGLLRSAQREQPRLAAQVIAIDEGVSVEALAALLHAEAAAMAPAEVRWSAGRRSVAAWRELASPAGVQPPWRAGSVVLVTGGLGGVGLAVARHLARRVPGVALVLAGRRALDEAGRAVLAELTAAGARANYLPLDVADAAAVQRGVDDVVREHGALHVVLHAAGVLRDGLLPRKTPADLQAVLAPKVDGTLNLDAATRDLPLQAFVGFSSVSAVHGNAGQADYAAANAFMDAFAAERNRRVAAGQCSGRTLSVNWPLWLDGGMQLDPLARQEMARATGAHALPTAAAVAALEAAWASGEDQVLVLHGEAERLRAWLQAPMAPAATEPRQAGADEALVDVVRRLLVQAAAQVLKVQPGALDTDVEFNEFGFDSVSLTTFGNRINATHGTRIVPTLFFEHPTLDALARALAAQSPECFAAAVPPPRRPASAPATPRPAIAAAPAPARAPAAGGREPVAIIGLSGRFPQADGLDAFWRNLVEGRDSITEVPPERWDWRACWGDPAHEPNKTLSKWGGFIDGIDAFDPLFFGLSPREAELMDPQQRLLLEHGWNCIEDAGYAAAALAGTRTAVFVGTAASGYASLVERAGLEIEGFTATGAVPSVGPNRLSFLLDLRGPSEPVETACSSALVALHRGVQALQHGECDLALVGGINTLVTPEATLSFSKAGMLSRDGRCKTFAAQADGYVRGEGVGLLLLKRLTDAERDGDAIHAVVRGSAVSHGGRTNSLTAPSPTAQAELVRRAWSEAGVDPRTAGCIEAHGTGTPLGDPVEVNGLKAAFAGLGGSTAEPWCALGSVKTNIGHLELAAGAAGVFKVVLQMQHRTRVPSLHCAEVNPYLSLEGSPFYLARETHPWPAPRDAQGREQPRRAGVSSFGFGGVNAHVVLEESTAPEVANAPADGPALIVLSARSEARLRERVAALRAWLRGSGVQPSQLADLAYTLQVGRDAMAVRLAFAVQSLDELAERLDAVLAGEAPPPGVFRGDTRQHRQDVALLAADEDAAQLARTWLAKGKHARLLEFWVQGLAVDWAPLHEGRRARRLHLPGYPFARERCWVPAPAAATPAAPPAARHFGAAEEAFFADLFQAVGNDSLSVDHALAQARRRL